MCSDDIRQGYFIPCHFRMDLHFEEVLKRGIHRFEVLFDDGLAFFVVGLLDGFFDLRDGFLTGKHTRKCEEAGLHDRVDAAGHAGVACDRAGVDDVEADLLVDDLFLHGCGQSVPHVIGAVGTVQQEGRSGLGEFQHLHFVEENELVACDEVRLRYEIGCTDRVRTETKVGDRPSSGFFRIVDEVTLCEEVGVLPDDLDAVFVGANRAIRAKSEEKSLPPLGFIEGE